MPPPACVSLRAVLVAVALAKPIVADGDVDPAVDAHADAVGGVVGAAGVDSFRWPMPLTSTSERSASPSPSSSMKDARNGRVADLERVVVVDEAARVVDFAEECNLSRPCRCPWYPTRRKTLPRFGPVPWHYCRRSRRNHPRRGRRAEARRIIDADDLATGVDVGMPGKDRDLEFLGRPHIGEKRSSVAGVRRPVCLRSRQNPSPSERLAEYLCHAAFCSAFNVSWMAARADFCISCILAGSKPRFRASPPASWSGRPVLS